jgi:hypothetical protein
LKVRKRARIFARLYDFAPYHRRVSMIKCIIRACYASKLISRTGIHKHRPRSLYRITYLVERPLVPRPPARETLSSCAPRITRMRFARATGQLKMSRLSGSEMATAAVLMAGLIEQRSRHRSIAVPQAKNVPPVYSLLLNMIQDGPIDIGRLEDRRRVQDTDCCSTVGQDALHRRSRRR